MPRARTQQERDERDAAYTTIELVEYIFELGDTSQFSSRQVRFLPRRYPLTLTPELTFPRIFNGRFQRLPKMLSAAKSLEVVWGGVGDGEGSA